MYKVSLSPSIETFPLIFLLCVNRTLLEVTRKNIVQDLIASPAFCFVYKKTEL